MSDRGETEAYLAAELNSLKQVHEAGDQAAVTRRIEHVRAEAGQETAAVLEQMLKEQEALRPAPPQPAFTPTAPAGGVGELTPPSRTKLLIVFSTVTVALLIVVAVLVTVIILRPPVTTTAPPSPQATSAPAGATTTPPTSTAASSTTVPPPVALSTVPPPQQAWTSTWPQPKQLSMPFDASADLDIPLVERGWKTFFDLYYGDYPAKNGVGRLVNGSDTLMGTGPATLPNPEECFSAAQALAVGHPKPGEMVPGTTAWCIVTKKGNLVWLHLLSNGGFEPSGNQQPTLTFELMQWKKPS